MIPLSFLGHDFKKFAINSPFPFVSDIDEALNWYFIVKDYVFK